MILIMPDNMSAERKASMAAYGAEIIHVTKEQSMEGARDLAMAMQATIDASNYLDKQTVIRYGLESILNEALRKPKRAEMLMSFKDQDLGIEYRTEMQQLRIVNVDGESLDHMWTLTAIAKYVEDGEEREERAELYVYRTN